MHGVHHEHPNDPLRLVMPPAVSIPLAALFLGLFALIFGTPAAYPAFAGFIAGYLTYDYTHYHLHHHVPRTAAGKQLREQHMRHHFQDHRYGYGVSSPLWDYVFRTRSQKLNDPLVHGATTRSVGPLACAHPLLFPPTVCVHRFGKRGNGGHVRKSTHKESRWQTMPTCSTRHGPSSRSA